MVVQSSSVRVQMEHAKFLKVKSCARVLPALNLFQLENVAPIDSLQQIRRRATNIHSRKKLHDFQC